MKFSNKSSVLVEIISALFIFLFLYTALSKSLDIRRTAAVLKEIRILANYAYIISWSVVGLEFIISLLLLFTKTRDIGLFASLILMLGFTGYIAYMIAFVPHLPCTCGGVISKMTWTQHLIFNSLFIMLGIIGIILNRRQSKMDRAEVKTSSLVLS